MQIKVISFIKIIAMNISNYIFYYYFTKKRLQENYTIINQIETEINNTDIDESYMDALNYLKEVIIESPPTPPKSKK